MSGQTGIVNRIYEWAREQPARAATVSNDITLGYGYFARNIEAQRRFFSQQDLPVGKTAVIIIRNRAYAWTVALALRSLGLTTIVAESIETARALALRNVACVVFGKSTERANSTKVSTYPGAKFIEVDDNFSRDLATGEIPSGYDEKIPFGDHIIFTSGTTGKYKKILKPGRLVMEHARVLVATHELDRTSIHHGFEYPMWTVLGYKYPLTLWSVGGCIIFNQGNMHWANLFKSGVTNCIITPFILRKVLELPDMPFTYQSQLSLTVGGGFLPYSDAKEATTRLTKNIFIRYGASELGSGGMTARFVSRDDLDTLTPDPGRVIEVVDEHGAQLPAGQEGELRIRLEGVDATGYIDDEETTAKFFRDGYFHPGDMAVKHADGRIQIIGRTADVLNIEGWKIAVAPLERAMQNTLKVNEVCLFSRFSDEGVNEVVVVIQSDKLPQQSELDEAVRRLPPSIRYHFRNVREFPRTQAGMSKVNRSALRQMVLESFKGE